MANMTTPMIGFVVINAIKYITYEFKFNLAI
jgi:hypothetical protein